MLLDRAPSTWAYVLLILASWSPGVFAGDDDLNIYGGSGPDVICVFPMSGPYNLLQRVLFYMLLVFAILGRRQRWLVFGALASAMSYSGAAALHGLLLVSPARKAIDLDVYGIFAVTSSGVMLTAPLLNWSTTLIRASKRHRYIVLLWGTVLLFGAIFTAACIYVNGAGFITPECLPPQEAATSKWAGFPSPTENCTYVCPPEARLFHRKSDVLAGPNHINRARDILSVFLPASLLYIFGWAVTELAFRTWLRNKVSKDAERYFPNAGSATEVVGLRRLGTFMSSRQNTSKCDGMTASVQPVSPAPSSPVLPQSQGRKPWYLPMWRSAHYYLMLAHFGAFITNVVLAEYRMKDFPMNEQPYEVGQWISWVSVALVVFAQVLNHYMKLRWGDDGDGRMASKDVERGLPLDPWRLGSSAARRRQEGADTRRNEALKGETQYGMKMFRSGTSSTARRNSF
ncbi:hypothetical protein FQN52_005772 [Onygenales sp. PD_12]|nr:hypothetical protein FQN52_005772 [Onygenales sp. PD_12]